VGHSERNASVRAESAVWRSVEPGSTRIPPGMECTTHLRYREWDRIVSACASVALGASHSSVQTSSLMIWYTLILTLISPLPSPPPLAADFILSSIQYPIHHMANLPLLLAAVATIALVMIVLRRFLQPKRIKLSRNKPLNLPLIEKFDVIKPEEGMHTMLFRFGLPSKDATLDLAVGQHVSLVFEDSEGKTVSRSYTPITDNHTKGHVDLIIKVYPSMGGHPPGRMGNYLKNLEIGKTVSFLGPIGRLIYKGNGEFAITKVNTNRIMTTTTIKVDEIAMIAGGTGITPMLQIIRAITHNPQDKTKMTLIFGNQTVGDIMCRKELDECAAKRPNDFKLWYQVDRAPANPDTWKYGVGYVTKDVIEKQFPKPSPNVLVLVCGPPRMLEVMRNNLTELGYSTDRIYEY